MRHKQGGNSLRILSAATRTANYPAPFLTLSVGSQVERRFQDSFHVGYGKGRGRCSRPPAPPFHRLFLGGLLPSRARFRLAGSLPIPVHMKLAQSRCPQFPCLTDGVQSSKASQNMVAYYSVRSIGYTRRTKKRAD